MILHNSLKVLLPRDTTNECQWNKKDIYFYITSPTLFSAQRVWFAIMNVHGPISRANMVNSRGVVPSIVQSLAISFGLT
jgi:hypothetical protein